MNVGDYEMIVEAFFAKAGQVNVEISVRYYDSKPQPCGSLTLTSFEWRHFRKALHGVTIVEQP